MGISSNVFLDIEGLSGQALVTPEVTRKEVGDAYNFLLTPLIDILNAESVAAVTALQSATLDDEQVVVRDIDEALALSLRALAQLATSGLALPSVKSDPDSALETYPLTIEMAQQLDLIFRTLKAAGLDVDAVINGSAPVPLDVIENFKNLSYTSDSVRNILSSAQLAATEHNRSLQAFIELVYVKTGNEIMEQTLSDLEEQLSTTKQALNALADIQNIHNNITVERKGDMGQQVNFTGNNDADIEKIEVYASELVPELASNPLQTTTEFFADLRRDFPALDLEARLQEINIPDVSGFTKTFSISYDGQYASGEQSSSIRQVWYQQFNSIITPLFNLPSDSDKLINSRSDEVEFNFSYSSKAELETRIRNAINAINALNNTVDFGFLTVDNRAKEQGKKVLNQVLLGLNLNSAIESNPYEILFHSIVPLNNQTETLIQQYNNAVNIINKQRLPLLNEARAEKGLPPIQDFTPAPTNSGAYFDTAAINNYEINIQILNNAYTQTILFPFSDIFQGNFFSIYPDRRYFTDAINVSQAFQTDNTELTIINQENNLLLKLYNAKLQLEEVREKLLVQTDSSLADDNTTLLSRVNTILEGLQGITSAVPTRGNLIAMTEWILDNYGSASGTPGAIQNDISFAITAAQTSNDSQKEKVRRFLFIFEEYYKSASAILTKITQILEKIAQGISR